MYHICNTGQPQLFASYNKNWGPDSPVPIDLVDVECALERMQAPLPKSRFPTNVRRDPPDVSRAILDPAIPIAVRIVGRLQD